MWIAVTFLAAAFQTSRTALQHRLRALLSVSGAGFVRYIYGAPLAFAAVGIALAAGVRFPSIEARFWPLIVSAGVCQVLATIYLIKAFDAGDFAIGTVYSKTEVVQTAVFSTVLLNESLSSLGWLAVVVCMIGVALLATKGRRLTMANLRDPAAKFGLLAGGLFGLTAIAIRAGSKALDNSPKPMIAVVSLAVMNTSQVLVHGGYLMVSDRRQIVLAVKHWRSSAIVGVLSVCGSACWSLAFVLQNPARVRTVGQVELLFTFAVSRWWLHDKHSRAEYWASALIGVGLLGVMLAG